LDFTGRQVKMTLEVTRTVADEWQVSRCSIP